MTVQTLPTTLIGLAFPVKRSPIWNTAIQEAVSGREQSFARWSFPRWRWNVQYTVLRSAAAYLEWQNLLGIYNQCLGAAGAFHYTDADDNSVLLQSIGVGDGSTKDFAFVRTLGGFVEPIQDMTAAGLLVYVDGTLKTLTTDYTILTTSQWGTNYGVHFVTAPPAGKVVAVSGNYTWLCRFDEDTVEFSKFMNQLWEVQQLVFVSLKQ